MSWFKRTKKNIELNSNPEGQTGFQKIDLPDGLWEKCPQCEEIIHKRQLEANLYVCFKCSYHFKIGSEEYFKILFDDGIYKELDKKLTSSDPLSFKDSKNYKERIKDTINKTKLNDAVRTATGKVNNLNVAIGCMDFTFIGGSMGSVVGEKLARLIDKSIKNKYPLIIISKSGGARMMEGALSLMQMAKTAAKLAKLSSLNIPYISVLTDPTTGGVTASFAMLGDINIAEPKALIGFAGPRVIKQTIGKDLPEGFQTSEFLLEHGFVDKVVNRKELKDNVAKLIYLMT